MEKFEKLYRMHMGSVLRFALSCVGRRDLAEDLTADAFLALHRNLDQIDESLLPGWLLTVVRNSARSHWRRQMVEQRYLEQLATECPEQAPPPLETWVLDSKDLKPVHRTCLMLRYVHGMSRAEIAERTGLSENQIKGHLQYALELLRKSLMKEERP